MNSDKIKDPAFGKISVSVVSGRTNLFMVDHPQHHFITLRIEKASLNRAHSNDYVFGEEGLIEVNLSETQWARLISTPNTTGVPCTLTDYWDSVSGKFIHPRLPDNHAGTTETFTKEIQEQARKTAADLASALKAVEAMLAGGSVKKSDLKEIKDKLYMANMELAENLPFVVKQAEGAVHKAVANGKIEIETHMEYSLQKLGERVLGDRLATALEGGVDPKNLGIAIAEAVTKKA